MDLNEALQALSFGNSCLTAATALYVYDRCLTFRQEVDFIWHRGRAVASTFYVLLQITTIYILAMLYLSNFVVLDCQRAYPAYIALSVGYIFYDTVLLAVISALRVYAVCGRDWRLSAVVLVLLLVRGAYDMLITVRVEIIPFSFPIGCGISPSSPALVPLLITSLGASILADAIVFIVTWRRTHHLVRLARLNNMDASVSSVLLRDGTMYFVFLFIMNCLALGAYLAKDANGVSNIVTVCSTIILSRLLLNLREASLAGDHTSDTGVRGYASSGIDAFDTIVFLHSHEGGVGREPEAGDTDFYEDEFIEDDGCDEADEEMSEEC